MRLGPRCARARNVVGGLAVVALTATACGGDDADSGGGGGDTGAPTTINVGTLPTANAAAMYLGIQEGFFEEEGLTIEPTTLGTGQEIVVGLVSGDFDFGFIGYISAGVAASQNVPVCVLTASDAAGTTPEDDWQVMVAGGDSPINGPQDLPGKTIGVNALGTVAEIMIKAALEKDGVDPQSIELLEVPFPEVPAAIAAGRIDAGFTAEPFVTQVLDAGGKVVMAPQSSLAPEYPNGSYSTSQQYYEGNTDVVERFTTAMNRSLDHARENPAAVREIIPTYTQIPPELADRIRLPVFTSELDEEAIDEQLGFVEQFGVAADAPSADELICGE
ncbi:ABC transporter substrate-binding protein [Geodermatophilus sabuli]|uniref:ABC transporter substrate-binding protein n=1 Tax=Geodermatophilus sabuli TaxID=1564158 RepID=A0A7K3W3M6_9ACTN|nr:ABC transporter substrate-binding protein [Geodermatophilus sabuli]NEK59486.1 ABC transporter substrate-binding protein [Geodermatophilus sabuli]